MNVLIIDFYHSTSNVGGLRWRKFAKYLPQFGITPIVLTSGKEDDNDFPNIFHVPYFFNIPVSNVNDLSETLWGRIKRFIRGNFFIPDPRRLWFAYATAKRLVEQFKIPLIITTGPPHSVHLLGLRLKNNLNVKWIADFRDPWLPYYYKNLYLTQFARFWQEYYEWLVVSSADFILAVEPGIVEHTHIISNGFDPDDFRGEIEPLSHFAYVGTLIDRKIIPGIGFKHIKNASHDEAVWQMRRAKALIIANPVDVIPAKVYEYLASERPIYSFGIRGKCAELIERCGAGKHFDFDEKTKIFTTGTFKLERNREEIEKYNVKELTRELARLIYYLWNVNAVL